MTHDRVIVDYLQDILDAIETALLLVDGITYQDFVEDSSRHPCARGHRGGNSPYPG